MTGSTSDKLGLVVKRIELNEAQLVFKLFDKYRVFYKKESDIALAESFISDRLSNNESVIFVAMINDSPVGFTQLYPAYSSARAVKNWILNDLYVDENYRKHGIGKSLIDKAMEFAKANNAKYVQLSTAVDNYNAQHLYETTGFVKQQPDDEFFMYRKNVD